MPEYNRETGQYVHRVELAGPEDTAVVTIEMDGETFELTVHPSKVHPGTVNVEIDGELAGRLRVHLNDTLVMDTANDIYAIDDPRKE